MSDLEMGHNKALYKFTFFTFFTSVMPPSSLTEHALEKQHLQYFDAKQSPPPHTHWDWGLSYSVVGFPVHWKWDVNIELLRLM